MDRILFRCRRRNGVVHARPVLLVHGILGQRHLYWNLFKKRLEDDKFRVHEVLLPYYLLGDIRIAANILKEKVEATCRGDRAEKVDLVCHSAGGLAARYYLKFLGGGKRVAHVVTLGTPHAGTYFSYALGLPFAGVARQTRPGSQFLKEISGPRAVPRGVRVTSFWSATDTVVLPAQSAVLPGARNVQVPWMHHWGFLWSSSVYNLVRDALLDRGASAKPTRKPARRAAVKGKGVHVRS